MGTLYPCEANSCMGIGRVEPIPVHICKSFGSIPPKIRVDVLSTKISACPHATLNNIGSYNALWTLLYLALSVIG